MYLKSVHRNSCGIKNVKRDEVCHVVRDKVKVYSLMKGCSIKILETFEQFFHETLEDFHYKLRTNYFKAILLHSKIDFAPATLKSPEI